MRHFDNCGSRVVVIVDDESSKCVLSVVGAAQNRRYRAHNRENGQTVLIEMGFIDENKYLAVLVLSF